MQCYQIRFITTSFFPKMVLIVLLVKMGRLANEKTLELNITHELMTGTVTGSIGFTQNQESLTGADVLFPCCKPIVLQFKATKSGRDGLWAKFSINNNKWKNQHQVLDAIDKSGLCRAFYVFPLVVSDSFLTSNLGRLLNVTCAVDASMLTGNLNWQKQEHSVIMHNNYNFTVRSPEEFDGEGFPARKLLEFFGEGEFKPNEALPVSKFIKQLVRRLDRTVQDAEIFGNSEHTIIVKASDVKRRKIGYLQLPVIIKGKEERFRKEKVKFL